MTRQPEPILDIAGGDIGLSRSLRRSLEMIRTFPAFSDPVVQRKLDEVLAGRASLREFGRSELFAKMFDQVSSARLDEIVRMPEDARAELARAGEEELERLRNLPVDSATGNASAESESSGVSSGSSATMPSDADVQPQSRSSVVPGTRKPDRNRVVTPDEPDDDDLYFQERNRRGWLE